MTRLQRMFVALVPALAVALLPCSSALSQDKAAIQIVQEGSSGPASGGYEPAALSLTQLLMTDQTLHDALMAFARTGDRDSFRKTIVHAAQEGGIGAELMLGKEYIPEQCTFESNQDVPHCGKDGNQPPQVVFRQNPLVDASYEEAARWLEKASSQGSGEASEVLAQLITRMQTNGHGTHYTVADSTRLHALARTQGFDVESISVTCYKLVRDSNRLSVARLPEPVAGKAIGEPFTPQELAALREAGISGSLRYEGGAGGGDSVLLMRPEGPVVNVRVILDHDPGHEVLLPMPAHHDEVYVQSGDDFLAFPGGGKVLPRFINIEPQKRSDPQVSISTELMDGGHSGGFCTRFP